jgi:hypothetical protein
MTPTITQQKGNEIRVAPSSPSFCPDLAQLDFYYTVKVPVTALAEEVPQEVKGAPGQAFLFRMKPGGGKFA